MPENEFVSRYKIHRQQFEPFRAYAIIATSIAIGGTIEDLKAVDAEFQNDIWNFKEEFNNERITG